MVASDHPADLLLSASQMVEIVTERPIDRWKPDQSGKTTKAQLLESFLEVRLPETTAVLTALAPLLGDDELLAARIRRELAGRSHVLPEWLRAFDQIDVTGTWETTDVLGDGDNVMIGVRWPTGHQLTAVIYIDHNMGTVVKDAFLVPLGVDQTIAQFRNMVPAGEARVQSLDPADARARIVEAVTAGEISIPPFETDTWPGCRAAIEWMASRLPDGGQGYIWPEWSDDERAALAIRFFSSAEGSPLAAQRDHHDLLDSILWFACDYGPRDPLRWSPVSVEILLVDWFPRKILAPAAFLARMPDVLRAVVAFAHRERGIPPPLTAETLAAIDTYEPEYQRLIRSDRPRGAEALALAALRFSGGQGEGASETWEAWDDDEWDDDEWDDDRPFGEIILERLAGMVGGREALDRLDRIPLPDEPFDWDGISNDVQPRVQHVLDLMDRGCAELPDPELGIVCRRLVHRAATGDPNLFRRQGRDEVTAAAVVWMAGKVNDLFSPRGGGVLVKDLLAWFGIQGSVSQKATTIRKAAGLPGDPYSSYDLRFADPGLLTSAERGRIIELRDRYLNAEA